MAPDHEHDAPRGAVDRSFRSTIRGESTAFGFSIMITVTFGAVQRHHGSPDAWDLMVFASCAVAAFTALEAVASRGFRARLPDHHSNVTTFGTALNFASVAAAVGTAIALSDAIATDAAWLACPSAAVLVYLVAESVEILLAERVQRARGDAEASQVSD